MDFIDNILYEYKRMKPPSEHDSAVVRFLTYFFNACLIPFFIFILLYSGLLLSCKLIYLFFSSIYTTIEWPEFSTIFNSEIIYNRYGISSHSFPHFIDLISFLFDKDSIIYSLSESFNQIESSLFIISFCAIVSVSLFPFFLIGFCYIKNILNPYNKFNEKFNSEMCDKRKFDRLRLIASIDYCYGTIKGQALYDTWYIVAQDDSNMKISDYIIEHDIDEILRINNLKRKGKYNRKKTNSKDVMSAKKIVISIKEKFKQKRKDIIINIKKIKNQQLNIPFLRNTFVAIINKFNRPDFFKKYRSEECYIIETTTKNELYRLIYERMEYRIGKPQDEKTSPMEEFLRVVAVVIPTVAVILTMISMNWEGSTITNIIILVIFISIGIYVVLYFLKIATRNGNISQEIRYLTYLLEDVIYFDIPVTAYDLDDKFLKWLNEKYKLHNSKIIE